MGAPCQKACSPWTTREDMVAVGLGRDDLAATIVDKCISAATDVLFELSGRKYPGICREVSRPCRQRGYVEYLGADGRRWGYCTCATSAECGCQVLQAIELPGKPLVGVNEVKVDGVALDEGAYRVDEYRWLVRLDGEGWPCCQRLDLEADEEGTFQVDYTYGLLPADDGVLACQVLASELTKSLGNDASCRLPRRLQSITRQGVTAVVLDPFQFLQEGRTGIYECDLFLTARNPSGGRRPAAVFSPDTVGPTARIVGT